MLPIIHGKSAENCHLEVCDWRSKAALTGCAAGWPLKLPGCCRSFWRWSATRARGCTVLASCTLNCLTTPLHK